MSLSLRKLTCILALNALGVSLTLLTFSHFS